jgi:acetyl-CoA carboxylase biotin carboxylase subunit
MIAKLIASRQTHELAIKMYQALSEYMIRGVKTIIPFSRAVMMDKGYISGHYITKFVDDFLARTPTDTLDFKNF